MLCVWYRVSRMEFVMHRDARNVEADNIGLPLLLTVEEAATLLRLGRTCTYQLVMGGRIPSLKLGRRRLVVRSDLENFVRKLVDDQVSL